MSNHHLPVAREVPIAKAFRLIPDTNIEQTELRRSARVQDFTSLIRNNGANNTEIAHAEPIEEFPEAVVEVLTSAPPIAVIDELLGEADAFLDFFTNLPAQ